MKITVHHKTDTVVTADKSVTVEELLRQNGIPFSMPCGGNHTCGKCRVRVVGSVLEITDAEKKLLCGAGDGVRLACFTKVTGDCEIFLNEKQAEIVSDGYIPYYPLCPIGEKYGFAVDIGTTTVAVYLYDLKSGERLNSTVFENPQSVFGADVISRITASLNGDKKQLREIIGAEITKAFSKLCKISKIAECDIDTAVITGNTTMLYLLLGYDVKCLSAVPFEIGDFLGKTVSAYDCAIAGFEKMTVYLPQTVSAFVGSDITCSFVSANSLFDTPNPSLLIDIGTNGEMVIKKGEKLFCCSTAAGPAFEGNGITMGSMAVSGAVNKVWLDGGNVKFITVNGNKPIGLCGSGLVDAVATFIECGLIDETGYIVEDNERFAEYVTEYNGEAAIKIGNSEIVITQNDIRALQLAKSAIRAGIESLLNECDVDARQVGKLVLAGGFGSYIDVENAAKIGLIPKDLKDKATTIGNAAGIGASAILLSKEAKAQSVKFATQAETVELSTSQFFMDAYIENMMF